MSYYNIDLTQDNKLIKEAPAAAVVTPGMLVEQTSGNEVTFDSGGTNPSLTFALENLATAGNIDLDYEIGDTTRFAFFRPGSQVYALLPAAAAAIAINDSLESTGDGTLQKFTTGVIVARATEAVDNSGGATTVRIVAEIL